MDHISNILTNLQISNLLCYAHTKSKNKHQHITILEHNKKYNSFMMNHTLIYTK